MTPETWAFHYAPKTEDQRRAKKLYRENDLLFLLGPAGTGKTHCALGLALQSVKEKEKKQVVFVRPLVEAGEKVGFLPGDLDEKIRPFLGPLQDVTGKMVFRLPQGILEVKTLAYMRGCTFDDCVVVLSEAQNCTRGQLKLILTRMGQNCKMIIEGDPDQSDLSSDGDDLLYVVEKMEQIVGVGVVDFDPSVTLRHPLVAAALRVL